jgi:type IV pilus assembly protein PilA
MNEKKKGFTLIELLVVMAIIAILAIIAIPQYNKYRANSAYSNLEKNLKISILWAENIVADYDKFPNGNCDALSLSGSGNLRCSYVEASDSIVQDTAGDLEIQIPFKVTFVRDNSTSTCGYVKVECLFGKCSGLANSTNNGNALICQNTCDNPSTIKTDNNMHGVVNGGCP